MWPYGRWHKREVPAWLSTGSTLRQVLGGGLRLLVLRPADHPPALTVSS